MSTQHKRPLLVILWLCHTGTSRKRETVSMFPICVTLTVPGLLAGLCHCVSSRAPACHVRQQKAGVLLVCSFYLFIFHLSPPSSSLLYPTPGSLRYPLLTSPSLHHLLVSVTSLGPLPVSLFLSLYLLSWVDSVES